MDLREPDGGPVECLGLAFESQDARREHFTKLLREKIETPRFRDASGFPSGAVEDILSMSDPPYHTACPNPWLKKFVAEHGRPYDPDEDYHREPFAVDVSEGKTDQLYRAHSYHTKVPHLAIIPSILHYTAPGDVVLDGFAGTGMTGMATRFCATNDISLRSTVEEQFRIQGLAAPEWGPRAAVVSDLSPIASFIAASYNLDFDPQVFEEAARCILDEVWDDVAWMYSTQHSDGREATINYTVWSEVFACPECAGSVPFVAAALDPETKKFSDSFPCPDCGASLTRRKLERTFTKSMDPATGDVHTGPPRVPVLINYDVDGETFEKTPDQDDLALIEQVGALTFPTTVPSFPLPYMHMTHERARMDHAGVTHLHHFFLPRQRHSLAGLWQRASAEPDAALRRNLLFFVEQAIWGMSLLNRYSPTHFSQTNRFMTGVYYVSAAISEVSPRYNLENKLKRLVKAFAQRKGLSRSIVQVGDCADLDLNDASIDYVFTDPPFGENIYYADLNYMLEAWHRVVSEAGSEAIVDRARGKKLLDYQGLMRQCFQEYYRVLKPGRWMTVVFSNSSNAVWHAIQEGLSAAGFVVADVRTLDKKQGSYRQVTSTAVKQDLVISAYKPSASVEQVFDSSPTDPQSVWEFVGEHLAHVPIFIAHGDAAEVIGERRPQTLFDRMIALHVQRGRPVPLSVGEFQSGLRERFAERDGMFFLSEQVGEYDRKRMTAAELRQLTLFVSDESSAIQWVRQQLQDKPQTFQDLQPLFMQQLQQWSKHEEQVELRDLLEENFLRYDGDGLVPSQIHSYLSSNFASMRNKDKDDGELRAKAANRWYVPDPAKEDDIQKLRGRTLLKQFEEYRTSTTKRLKEFRTEAVRAGFKDAYDRGDYSSIVAVAHKLPDSVLLEDEKLLMYYDVAQMRSGE